MKKINTRFSVIVFAVIAFQFISFSLMAQSDSNNQPFKGYVYLQPNIGISQYFGSLNQKDYWNQNPKFAWGAVLGYQICPVFGLRTQFMKTNLYSERSDKNQELNADLWDGALNLTINVSEIFAKYNAKRFFNFYLFGGAGYAFFNSTVKDISSGALADASTGQNEFVMPVGAGASFRLSYNFSINVEYGDRTMFNGTNLDFTQTGDNNNVHYSYASAGLQIRFGPEDRDGDGVKDKNDLCPEVPGKVELAGCPDKDNDGVADKDDACPDIAGKPAFKGCPDTDGDGIIDGQDACPTLAGPKELNGCPDKDGDGVADKDDKCPDVFGKKELAGCPDKDGDGIADKDDACPDVKGLPQYKGCPDTDGDGIPDNTDKCPDVFGVATNYGCPEAVKGVVMQKTVYFNSDASVVLARDIIILNEISAYMNEHPSAVISVAGYADNRESVQYNLRLSEKRADWVIEYLKKKGMKSVNIEKSFFGKSNPVADNSTAAGRALNRRVEIKITE
jgi:OmpA-OmpF porin, OOP family